MPGGGTASGTTRPFPTARRADVVAALVMQDDLTESADRYARYTLRANGVRQPAG